MPGSMVAAILRHQFTVRNRTEPLVIYVIEDVHPMAARLNADQPAAGETS